MRKMFDKAYQKRLLFVFMFWIGLLFSCESHQAEKPKEQAIRVEAVAVKRGEISKEIKFTGNIEANAEVQIFPKISARIEAIMVDMGDRVKKDDLLALLESDELSAQVTQAEAVLHNLQARWKQMEVGARPEEISQAEDLVEKARAKLRDAESHYERMKGLFQRGVIAKRDLESAELAYRVAQADLNSAQKHLKMLIEGATKEEREALQAQIRQAEAALEVAKIRVSYTRITSPINGIVSRRFFEVGHLATPTQPLFTIVKIDSVKVIVFFPEDQARFIRPGIRANLSVVAYPDQVFQGVIDKVSPTLDPTTRLFSAEIKVTNQGYLLRPSMFTNVSVFVEPRRDVLLVPKEAVLLEEEYPEGGGSQRSEVHQNHYVFILKEGKAYRRRVLLGHESGSFVEIREGVEFGDQVVTRGVHLIKDGDRVIVTHTGEEKR